MRPLWIFGGRQGLCPTFIQMNLGIFLVKFRLIGDSSYEVCLLQIDFVLTLLDFDHNSIYQSHSFRYRLVSFFY